jgi:RND family efflux transporter MFP subunit
MAHRFWNSRILTLFAITLAVASGASLLLSGCSQGEPATKKEQQLYTCGMHPQVIQNKPGKCPICGMNLTPIRKQGGASNTLPSSASGSQERKIKYYKSTMISGEVSPTPRKDSMGMEMVPVYEEGATSPVASSTIEIDSATVQNMDLRTGIVTRGPLRRVVRTVGTVEFDEAALAEVTTKFKGWVEKLYADTTGQQLHRGEPLFEIYSPELYSAQTEYVLAMNEAYAKSSPGAELVKNSALDKLRYFDVSQEQIAELEKTRRVNKTLRVSAPRDGIVVEKLVVEGQMVDAGMKLYRLADLGTVWVQSQVYEQDLPFVRLGQEATVSLAYLPDRKFRGRVTFIYPTVDDKTRTAKVRMEFHNPGFFLKPGMFTTVELVADLAPSAVLVPDMAVLRSGEKNTVFVALDAGRFEPRTVVLGPRAENNMYQVLSGLNEGERIVTSGQFMLDSESQLREAIQKMLKPGTPGELAQPTAPEMTSLMRAGTNGLALQPEKVVYICPMPEHVALEYDRPGKCPLCGMNLVPVTREMLAKVQPGGEVEYYTCPMPEHSDVRESKPGKCPRCGMTLVPVMHSKPASTPSTNTISARADQASEKLYTCPMASHADVVSDKPGTCPKCEMKLVETSRVAHGKIAEQNWHQHPR